MTKEWATSKNKQQYTAEPCGEVDSEPLSIAAQGARLLNLFVDSLLISFGSSMLPLNKLLAVYPDQGLLVAYALGVLPMACYYLFFEGLLRRTPGKFLTGTIVVDEEGAPPTLKQLVVRTVVRLIPFEPLSFLFRTVGWHDRWSGTLVVRVG